ncbi:MAG: IPT/TIG domain-containing protein [Terracidiphilus sp.]
MTVSVTGSGGFASSVSMTVSGLPAGVTATPASFNLMPGSQQVVALNAVATATVGTATVTFQGTSGSLSQSAQVALSVVAAVTGAHPPIRTQYVRTNSFYDPNSMQYAPPHFSVYDPVHKQFFVSNPFMNEIDVFSTTQENEIATIPVPLAWGIDVSPYNGSLYAGTLIGDLYQIDTSTLTVTTRYPEASIGPSGFPALTALVLSDGRLALQGTTELGILGVDGFGSSAVWNPVTNALDTGTNGSVCDVGHEGGFALSGDRTRILVTWVDTSASAPICSYDPIAQVATYGSLPTPLGSPVKEIIPTPDGTRFFLTTNLQGVVVFDAKTVQMIGQITNPNSNGPGDAGTEIPNAAGSGVISLDGKTLYLANQTYTFGGAGGALGAYDTTTYQQTGWVPSFSVFDSQNVILPGAIDETGLIVGPIGHGVAFNDASQLEANAPTQFVSTYGGVSTGPLTGGTSLDTFLAADVTDNASLSQIYVGNIPGSDASFSTSPGNENNAQVTTPPSNQAGAVDLAVVLSDGGVGIAVEGFSYGPTILEVIPNGATADGGQTGAIIGYGFGDSTSGIQVTVGGQSAPVTAVYNYPPIQPYPFPANSLQFTIPPGTAGAAVDVTVTTPSGSATAAGVFHYTAAAQTYPVTANLQAGIYDAGRNLYYFADQAQIQVLSASTGKWLSPIALPGVSSKTQLLAISESPDGTQLAVSDYGDQAIYVLNPDSPASATSYPMSLENDGFPVNLAPSGLAVTNAGMVYFYTGDIGGTGDPALHKLDTSTSSITDLYILISGAKMYPPSGSVEDSYVRAILSPDGKLVYMGYYIIDTSSDQIIGTASGVSGGFPDFAISGDGDTLDAEGELTDYLFNTETETAYIDWETWFPTSVGGQKLNHDGSILFQPLTDGIDMIARNTGRLLYRIQIPVTPANVYDPLVVAEGQNTLAVITATGVSFVDLSSLPISAEYTQPFPAATHTRMGSTAYRQTAPPSRRAVSSRAEQLSARPRLRHRLEKPHYSVKTP